MELRPYFYKRKLEDTHSGYGIVAISVEECPIKKGQKIGCACTYEDCCQGHARFMRIKEDRHSWIMCEATSKIMDENPRLGQSDNCVVWD